MGGVRFDACRNAHLPYETLTFYLDSETLSRMRVPFSILATVFSSRQKVRGGGDDDDDDDDDDVDDDDADDDADDDEEDDASFTPSRCLTLERARCLFSSVLKPVSKRSTRRGPNAKL